MTIDESEQRQIRDILQQARVAEQWMDQELPPVQERSALWTDNQRSHPYDVSQGITHAMTVATDHLHAMRMALTGVAPNHISLHAHAPFTLLRAALENACTALWLTGAPNRDERILRRLRLEAKSVKHNEQLLRMHGVDCAAPSPTATGGFCRCWTSRSSDRPQPASPGCVSPRRPNWSGTPRTRCWNWPRKAGRNTCASAYGTSGRSPHASNSPAFDPDPMRLHVRQR